ncbi:uncharacterized protein [Nicotiana tomentosiformis]|uniref:uncharacterized protein n=1 Tax=Nicotiana tomentosiformis TaxID=4098 RepID=UPI00388C641E
MDIACHGQLYQNMMASAFHKRVKPRQLALRLLVLEIIFPHQEEAKEKFAPNCQGPYVVHQALSGGALILAEIDGSVSTNPINSDAIKSFRNDYDFNQSLPSGEYFTFKCKAFLTSGDAHYKSSSPDKWRHFSAQSSPD